MKNGSKIYILPPVLIGAAALSYAAAPSMLKKSVCGAICLFDSPSLPGAALRFTAALAFFLAVAAVIIYTLYSDV